MSRLKPMIIVLLMLTSALAGCVDRDNHPDHHDDEPGLHHHGDEDFIISMRRTIRQNMLNPIDTIVMMKSTMRQNIKRYKTMLDDIFLVSPDDSLF